MVDYDSQGATWNDLALGLRANFIDYEDYPVTGNLLVEIRNNFGSVELPRGRTGPQGAPGKAAKPFESVRSIPTAASLPSNPTAVQKATAYVARDTGMMWAWDETIEVPAYGEVGLFRGERGETGPTAEVVAGNIAATAPGTAPAHSYEEISPGVFAHHMTVPRGEEGPEGPEGPQGPAASIALAADVQFDTPPKVGDVLTYTGLNKWQTGSVYRDVGPYSPDPAAWTTGGASAATQRTVVTLTIPAQPWPWRPKVTGHLRMGAGLGTRVDAELRIGSTDGAVCAVGCGPENGTTTAAIATAFPGVKMTPTSTYAVVPANTEVTLYLVARRVQGVLLTEFMAPGRDLQVWCSPVDSVG